MRSAEITKGIFFTPLPTPDKTGKVKCEAIAKWCVYNLIELGDANARLSRIRDGE